MKSSYIICATRRSGSWLLAGGLEDTKIAGHPSEWFNDQEEATWCECWGLPYPIQNYEEYLNRVIDAGSAGTGIFGAKILGYNFKQLESKLRTIPKYQTSSLGEILRKVLPDTRYIFQTRRNKDRQAISYYRAKFSGIWHDLEGHPPPANSVMPLFDPEEIMRGEEELKAFEKFWEDYFQSENLNPMRIEYEDLAANYEKTIHKVLEYIGIEESGVKITPPRFKKQAGNESEAWVAMYRAYKLSKGLN